MFKIIVSLTFLFSFGIAYAKSCSVYGISNSPQSLNCTFHKIPELRLRCVNGSYFLNSSNVSAAYHLEVETGPVPLVFKSREGELTVLINNSRSIKAILANTHYEYSGKCQHPK